MKSTVPIRDLTAAARAGLSGNWGKSIGVMLTYFLLSVAVSHVPFVGWLLSLVFSAPLIVGMTIYLLATVRKQSNPFSLLFAGFDRFGASLCTWVLVGLILTAWMVPLFILMAVMIVACPFMAGSCSPTVWALWAVLILSMLALMIPLQMRYGLALYVVADDPAVKARQAVRRGVELMKGNYWRLGLLWLRFIGWQILAVLTFGIGLIWLAPYFMAATTAFYDDLVKNGKAESQQGKGIF